MYRGTLHKTIELPEEEETELGVETKDTSTTIIPDASKPTETATTLNEVVDNKEAKEVDLDSTSKSVNYPTAPLKTSSQDLPFTTPPSTPGFQRKNPNVNSIILTIFNNFIKSIL